MERTKGRRVPIIMVGLVVLSFVIYSLFFSWGFAVLIIVSLIFHEYGHVWAMQRCGMKVSGIYLIPFVGGAAVPRSNLPSQATTVFIYLAGPAFGLALAAVTACGYLLTGWPLLAGATFWMTILNLFNLLPIFPLDGGGVIRAITYSVHSIVGGILQIASLLFVAFLVYVGAPWIFWIVLCFALIECMDYVGGERRRRKELCAFLSDRLEALRRGSLSESDRLHLSLLLQQRKGIDLLQADRSIPSCGNLLAVAADLEEKFREPPPLSGRSIFFSVGGYVLIVVIFLVLALITGMVPGSLESIKALIGQ